MIALFALIGEEVGLRASRAVVEDAGRDRLANFQFAAVLFAVRKRLTAFATKERPFLALRPIWEFADSGRAIFRERQVVAYFGAVHGSGVRQPNAASRRGGLGGRRR